MKLQPPRSNERGRTAQPFRNSGIMRCENALLVAERRGRIPREGVSERLEALRELPILTDRSADLESTLELAMAHQLSFYDALYLELATRLDAALATLDQALATAARGSGLETLTS